MWWVDLSVAHDGADAVLSPDELARAARFRYRRDRVRWTRAREAVRHILAGYLGQPPHDLRFTTSGTPEAMPRPPSPIEPGTGSGGVRAFSAKPALANDPRLRFNLAHAGDRAVLAVAWEREVGIDLEPVDTKLDLPPLLIAACTPSEIIGIEALPPDQRSQGFLACWTAKEAYFKAIGIGLFREPRTLELEFLIDRRVVVHDAQGDDPLRWDVRLLDAGPGWVAALAVASSDGHLCTFTWPLPPHASS